jgi:hypothetical protein
MNAYGGLQGSGDAVSDAGRTHFAKAAVRFGGVALPAGASLQATERQRSSRSPSPPQGNAPAAPERFELLAGGFFVDILYGILTTRSIVWEK